MVVELRKMKLKFQEALKAINEMKERLLGKNKRAEDLKENIIAMNKAQLESDKKKKFKWNYRWKT